MLRLKEVDAKSIITKSNLPDADYVVNPYTGCEFGCQYCYASFMCRYVNEPIEDWGKFVYIKKNAVALFTKEIQRLCKKNPSIFLSSVTDPYQGVEAKYQLTRGILDVLAQIQYQGLVGILTKSAMVVRDIDLFKKLPNVEVGLTITSTDDDISRFMEVKASDVSARIRALKELNNAGIKTYVFVGPLMPHFAAKPELMDDLFKAIADAGTTDIYVEQMNMKPYIMQRLAPALKNNADYVKNIDQYKIDLNNKVQELVKKYNFTLRLNQTIEHNELTAKR